MTIAFELNEDGKHIVAAAVAPHRYIPNIKLSKLHKYKRGQLDYIDWSDLCWLVDICGYWLLESLRRAEDD